MGARTLSVLTAIVAALATHASGAEWMPDAKAIAKLESTIVLANAENLAAASPPAPLARYARYYAGITVRDHKMIRGELVLGGARGGVHVVHEADLPIIFEGGCGVVSLLYDTQTAQVIWIRCNNVT